MNSTSRANRGEGLTLRQAALIAGFGYLLGPVTYAEFSIYPKLVIPTNIEQTVQNIVVHRGLFAAAILCYLIEFIEDIVIAWALYYLLQPSIVPAYSMVQVDVYSDRFLRDAEAGDCISRGQHAGLPRSLRVEPLTRRG